MGVFDLRSCYFHVMLNPAQTTFFGVKCALDGVPTYMVFDYLPFGLSSAVHCVTKLWKPLISYFQMNDISISIYIDDGLFVAPNMSEWNSKRQFTVDTITKAGWVIAEEKSDKVNEGATKKPYLGFDIDSSNMILKLPARKIEKISSLIDSCTSSPVVKAKFLAKVWLGQPSLV